MYRFATVLISNALYRSNKIASLQILPEKAFTMSERHHWQYHAFWMGFMPPKVILSFCPIDVFFPPDRLIFNEWVRDMDKGQSRDILFK